MAVPDYQTLMLPLLQIVENKDHRVSEFVDKLSDKFNLSEEERQLTIPSGTQTLMRNRSQWAATYLSKAGLLCRPQRGVVRITEEGKKALRSGLKSIDNNYLKSFETFKEFVSLTNPIEVIQSTDSSFDETPEDTISSAYMKFETTTCQELLDLILKSSPLFFERLILNLFRSMGYGGKGKLTHMGKSGDGGIDGIIDEDPLGLEKIYLQAKRYAPENKIQIDQIRSFTGTLMEQGARKGIFVTTSSFVSSAYDYVQKIPQSLILIDGNELTKLIYQYDVGVRTIDSIKLKKIDADYFEEA